MLNIHTSIMSMNTTMNTIDKMPFLRLVQALDPLFPIGAFTLSNGMETYVQKNIVKDKNSLLEFLTAYLFTLPTGDAGFAARSALGDDPLLLMSFLRQQGRPLNCGTAAGTFAGV